MSKNFDDFMKILDSKDWSLVIQDIQNKIKNQSPENAQTFANLYMTTILLREYHNWVNK